MASSYAKLFAEGVRQEASRGSTDFTEYLKSSITVQSDGLMLLLPGAAQS